MSPMYYVLVLGMQPAPVLKAQYSTIYRLQHMTTADPAMAVVWWCSHVNYIPVALLEDKQHPARFAPGAAE